MKLAAALALGLSGTAALLQPGLQPAEREAETWIDVPPQPLAVAAGSPLDFSALVPTAPAGSRGALTITPQGTLAFARGEAPVRFHCGVLANSPFLQPTLPGHDEADALALQLRRHGYSLIRLHQVDAAVVRDAGGRDAINPEQLNRLHYLLAALKRNGIHWMVDIVSAGRRRLAYQRGEPAASPDDLRVRMNFDPVARAAWSSLVDGAFAVPNPYTGRSVLADPALAFVVGANESALGFAKPFPTGLAARFDQWVRGRYASSTTLAAALPDASAAERAGTAPVALPADWRGSDARTRLALRFASDLEVGTYRWMQAELRRRGFRGPLLGGHEWYGNMTGRTRAALPIIDVHAYVGEVTSFAAGTRLTLPRATSRQGSAAWLLNASARWLDRPFVASEYGTAFPNPHRHESGLLFPAMAGLQGYAAICRTAFSPVAAAILPPSEKGAALTPYLVGTDPVERANETVAALLFARRDVAPATATVALVQDAAERDVPNSVVVPLAIREAALLARFGLADKGATLPRGWHAVTTDTTPSALPGRIVGRVQDMWGAGAAAKRDALIAALRASGELPATNATDPPRDLFQSQTGELTLDRRAGRILVATPRTVAMSAISPAEDVPLGALRLLRLTGGATIAASALDGQPVATSRRVLLVLAGDARNSGMRMEGEGTERTLRDWGHAPIQLRRVQASLRVPAAGQARLTILSLAGAPLAVRVLAAKNGQLDVALDTAAVPGNPTTFFLLERN